MSDYQPPFHITGRMTSLIAEICEQAGRMAILYKGTASQRCRRENRIRTIHPLADGNGRIGRLWHTLLLGSWKELFFWLPVEELIRERQKEYYDALGRADKEADSAGFVELMLDMLKTSLQRLADAGNDQDTAPVSDQVTAPVSCQASTRDQSPVERLLSAPGNDTLPAKALMERLGLFHKATFRKNYLNPALDQKCIERTIPDRPNSRNQKYRKV